MIPSCAVTHPRSGAGPLGVSFFRGTPRQYRELAHNNRTGASGGGIVSRLPHRAVVSLIALGCSDHRIGVIVEAQQGGIARRGGLPQRWIEIGVPSVAQSHRNAASAWVRPRQPWEPAEPQFADQ